MVKKLLNRDFCLICVCVWGGGGCWVGRWVGTVWVLRSLGQDQGQTSQKCHIWLILWRCAPNQAQLILIPTLWLIPQEDMPPTFWKHSTMTTPENFFCFSNIGICYQYSWSLEENYRPGVSQCWRFPFTNLYYKNLAAETRMCGHWTVRSGLQWKRKTP